ncbi:MAG: hypothetical protein KC423_24725 [Anaerolineales bacterium]|nr:hypothetical protein [Anaerolineales bacterium]
MPVLKFTSENLPSPEEFRRLLAVNDATYDPLEELLRLERDFVKLEQTYGFTSAEFYAQYQAGKLGDDMEFMSWAGRYTLYLRLKNTISTSLERVVTADALAA